MSIKPIHNDDDHAAAVERIDALWGAAAGTPEADELEVLGVLVDAYERKRWTVGPVSQLEILRYMIDEAGHTLSELALILGSRPSASEVLAGKRELSVDQIRRISEAWHISADSLIAAPIPKPAKPRPTASARKATRLKKSKSVRAKSA